MTPLKHPVLSPIILLCLINLIGCKSHAPKQAKGFIPNWTEVGEIAWHTAQRTDVWLPSAAAITLQIGDSDHELNDWIFDNSFIYRDADHAELWGERLLVGSDAIDWITTVVGALPLDGSKPAWRFFHTTAIERISLGTTGIFGDKIREFDGETACTAAHNQLSLFHLARSKHSPELRSGLRSGLTGLISLQAWTQVEAGNQTPSQSLAGMAIGNFGAHMLMHLFIPHDNIDEILDEGPILSMQARPEGNTIVAGWRWPY